MKTAGWATVLLAIIVLIGGVVGFIMARSLASLIAGIGFGILLLIGGIGTLRGKKSFAILSVLCALILDGFFTYRFFLSFSFMPSGMMALLSLAILAIQVSGLRHSPGKRHTS